MSGEFLGKHTNAVNKSKWITIPAQFKKKFSPAAKQTVIVTIGPQRTIAIYPLDNWNKLMLDKNNSDDARQKEFIQKLRFWVRGEEKMETNGRIKLDEDHLKIAGIDKRVTIVGNGTFMTVWNPDRYEEYSKKMLEDFQDKFDEMDYQI